jgi:hypothetical protein
MLYAPTFVDNVTSDGTPASALNLKQELEQTLGHTVRTFTGVDSASLSAALSGADALMIPSLEKGNLAVTFTNASKAVIRSFVAGGGGFISTGDPNGFNTTVISDVFLFPAFTARRVIDNDIALTDGAGTQFSTGPAFVRDTGGVYAVDSFEGSIGSKIPGAKNVYSRDVWSNFDPESALVLLPYSGRLSVAFLGRDWARGGPNGTQDGNWAEALSQTVKQVARPAPATPAAPSTLVATIAGTNQVNLAWKDNSANETAFIVDRSAISTFGSGVISTSLPANTKSFAATGLVAGTTYYFRVRAANGSAVSTPSNVVTAKTPKVIDAVAGKLTVSGTGGADPIRLTLTGTQLTARVGNVSQAFSTTAITSILIQAFDGDDLVTVGPGVRGVRIEGGVGNDTLIGGANADSIFGQAGNDVLIGGAGADSLDGGDGNDLFYALDGVTDSVIGGNGTDTLYGDSTDVRSLVEDVLV